MMVQLKYFSRSEFMMGKVNVADDMKGDFLLKLDTLRDLCGFPFRITSSFRTPEYNVKIGGAKNSMHLTGRAVDIQCTESDKRATIIRHALNLGLTVGVMEHGIHIDDREDQIVFHYYHNYTRKKSPGKSAKA